VGLIEGDEVVQSRESYFETREFQKCFGWAPVRGVEYDGFKLIDLPLRELYALDEDPAELVNVASERNDLADRLQTLLEQIVGATSTQRDGSLDAPFTREALDALVKLGYSAPGSAEDRPVRSIDPKERRAFWQKYKKVRRSRNGMRPDYVRGLLEEMIAEEPDALICHYLLGRQLWREKDYARAIEHLRQAAGNEQYRLACFTFMATMSAELGHYDDAVRFGRQALDVDPHNLDMLWNMVKISIKRGDQRAAADYARRVLDRNPGHPGAAQLRRIFQTTEQ